MKKIPTTFQRNSSYTRSCLHSGWSICKVIKRLGKNKNGHWIRRRNTSFRHNELLGFSLTPSLFSGFNILSTDTVLRGFCEVSCVSCFLDFIHYLSFLHLAVQRGSSALFQARSRCWNLTGCSDISHVTSWPPPFWWRMVTVDKHPG